MYSAMAKFRRQMDEGVVCVGPNIGFTDAAVTEALGPSVDFVWLDLEHTPLVRDCLQQHLIAARATGTPALVRVPQGEPGFIKPVLDMGAPGIIVPQLNSAEEARRAVSACLYPPLGTRGYGPRRAANYGREEGGDYPDRANEKLFVVIQVETAGALRELDEILSIPGVDSIVVGPYDLSGALGRLGQLDHPEVTSAVETVVRRSREAGKYVGTGMGPDPDYAARMAKIGVQWIQCGNDCGYMIKFAEQLLAGVRQRLAGR
jgi:2-dehydro-3-deoxyglucarate aldolase/4-hydroxy-2-oxoheptanedioate aldolase